MKQLTKQDFGELGPGQQKRIPNLAGLDEFYYGINSTGRQYFMFRGKFAHSVEPSSTHLLETKLIAEKDGVSQLQISLNDAEFLPNFVKLIYSIIEAVELLGADTSDQDKFYTALTNLNDWKELFRAARKNKISENQIIGLLGELRFLLEIYDKTGSGHLALEAWQGPFGNDEDFSFDGNIYEVKSSRSSQNSLVKINSLRQLNSTYIPTYLIHQSFSPSTTSDPNAMSLYQAVTTINSILEYDYNAVVAFQQSLLLLGYLHHEKYMEPCFCHDDSTYYAITDDFPLIYSNQVDPRISRVRYSLDLDKCKEYMVDKLPFNLEVNDDTI